MPTTAGRDSIEFLKSKNNLFRNWQECQGHACEIEGVALSMSRSPPPLAHPSPHAPPPPPKPKKVPAPKHSGGPLWDLLLLAGKVSDKKRAFNEWLETPPPPKPAPTLPSPASHVPPFDIQDVPKAMDKLSMPMSAKLQRRWFAGYENHSRTEDDLRNEIDQNGNRYAPAMVDDTTITMKWVLGWRRAKEAFDELIREKLRTEKAIGNLKKALLPYRHHSSVMAFSESNRDFLKFHQQFQFQLMPVNSGFRQRMSSYLDRSLNAGGVPDDLTGALGSFNFYAAVQLAHFYKQGTEALVTHIYVYVRDPYEFTDDQYLGHWSPSHVAVVPAHHLAGGKGWLQYPVVHGDVRQKDSVLYPVTNKDYRDWRARHKQGGDFIIYSDRFPMKLDSPITVSLL
ncbi:MAG: hypothetical protein J7605_01925 [Variovorax sp.]|nr:hypothetical protein [Variovorax sp.]